MTTYDDLDLGTDTTGPATQRLFAELERHCAVTMPPLRRAEIAHHLAGVAARQPVGTRQPLPTMAVTPAMTLHRHRRWYARSVTLAASGAAAALVALGGLFGYMRLQNPTPAAAAVLLHRAAGAMSDVEPNHVVHEITRFHQQVGPGSASQLGNDVTYQQWSQVDAHGNPLRVDIRATSSNPTLNERLVADSQGNLWSSGADPTRVTRTTWTPGTPLFGPPVSTDSQAILYLPKQTMNAPQSPSVMHQLLLAAAAGTNGQTRLLPQQTIQGRTVDVIQVTRSIPAEGSQAPQGVETVMLTIYLDDSTFHVRRIAWRDFSAAGTQVQEQLFDITTYEVVPVSAVPSGTFTFTPGPTMLICTPHEPRGMSAGSPPGDRTQTCTRAGK